MFYYTLLFLLLTIGTLYRKRSKEISIVALIYMTILVLLRSENVGTDTLTYLNIFTESSRETEWLTTLLFAFVVKYNLESRMFLDILTIITYIVLPLLSYRYKIKLIHLLFFFFVLGFFAMSMNIARQMASCCIVVLALSYVYEEENKKSVLFFPLMLLASGLHYSSYFFFPCYFARFVNIDKTKMIMIVSFIAPLLLFNVISIDNLTTKFLPVAYDGYRSILNRNESVSLLGWILMAISLIVRIYLSKFISEKWFLFFIIAILFSASTAGMHSIVTRLFYPFVLFSGVCYSMLLEENKRSSIVRIGIAFIISWLCYSCFIGLYQNPDLNNYQFRDL